MSRKDKQVRSFPGQHDHEEVQLVFRHHLMAMRKQILITGVLLVVALLPVVVWPTNSVALKFLFITALFALGYFIRSWASWYYSVYIATNERLIEVRQHGFFDRRVTEFGLDKIQNINYHIKGLQAVMFRYGDIAVQTYVGDLVMRGIHNPVNIQEKLVRIVHQFAGKVE